MDLLKAIIEFVVSIIAKKEVSVSIPLSPPPAEEPPKQDSLPPGIDHSLVLTHTNFCEDGIFGKLERKSGGFVCYTLEHSYANKPKLADGSYTCVRGPHRLHGMTEDFITFEIKGVPDFNGIPVTGVLFHWGNYNKDSEGCVLMGSSETPTMIGNSRQTWADFMQSMDGIDSFSLEVRS